MTLREEMAEIRSVASLGAWARVDPAKLLRLLDALEGCENALREIEERADEPCSGMARVGLRAMEE